MNKKNDKMYITMLVNKFTLPINLTVFTLDSMFI